MRVIICDGSNLVMRAAFGGDIEPQVAVKTATGLIERAARQCQATHLVVALDSPTGTASWRRSIYPAYKANRTKDTQPWLLAACEAWTRKGWWVEEASGFEADDLLATLAIRLLAAKQQAVILSGDSDLLPLLSDGAEILKPYNGGIFLPVTEDDVRKKYDIEKPSQLVDLKAMTGETGDNVEGVISIGPKRAAKLLFSYDDLEAIIEAGFAEKCRDSIKVAEQAEVARLAKRLVTLDRNVPIPPINPSKCRFNQ